MEWSKVSMIPTTEDSSGCNGSGTIATSDRNPRTSSSSTIGTITTAASKVKPPYRSSTKKTIYRSCLLQSSNCQKSIIFQTEPSPSSVSSEVTGSSISLENIFNFLKNSSILIYELKSLLVCTRFKSTLVMSWLPPFHTVCQHGLRQISKMGNLCGDTY